MQTVIPQERHVTAFRAWFEAQRRVFPVTRHVLAVEGFGGMPMGAIFLDDLPGSLVALDTIVDPSLGLSGKHGVLMVLLKCAKVMAQLGNRRLCVLSRAKSISRALRARDFQPMGELLLAPAEPLQFKEKYREKTAKSGGPTAQDGGKGEQAPRRSSAGSSAKRVRGHGRVDPGKLRKGRGKGAA